MSAVLLSTITYHDSNALTTIVGDITIADMSLDSAKPTIVYIAKKLLTESLGQIDWSPVLIDPVGNGSPATQMYSLK